MRDPVKEKKGRNENKKGIRDKEKEKRKKKTERERGKERKWRKPFCCRTPGLSHPALVTPTEWSPKRGFSSLTLCV